jgi:hypothetical protein
VGQIVPARSKRMNKTICPVRPRLFDIFWISACLLLAPQAFAQVTILSEGFEGSFPGSWTVGDSDPFGTPAYWGAVDSAFGGEATHTGTRKAYCAGVGFGGTPVSPTYQNEMISFMSRQINLGGLTSANLSFWLKIPSIEDGVEIAGVYIDNTMVWSTSAPVSGWSQVTLSLDQFVGGLRSLKFQFLSDSSFPFEGWYVDDILVTGVQGTGPANDSFANAVVISGASGTLTSTNTGATKEGGEPNHASNPGGKSVWYRWTPGVTGTTVIDTVGSSFDTLLAIYTGTDVASLTLLAANNDLSASVVQSRVLFSATAGTTYRIAVDGNSASSGSFTLHWTEVTGAPLNNDFSSAVTISGVSGSIMGTNINATKQSSEPNHAGDAGGASIWYKWTPASGGQVTFNTLGSTFDTLLGVYTGSAVGSLTAVATNDDVSVSYSQSQVTFNAVSGTTYRIAVDGYAGDIGAVQLNWAQGVPSNDFFATPIILSGPSGTINGSNFNASLELNEPNHAGEPGGHSVWYRWTAPATGPIVLDTAGSALDTVLAVYTGSLLQSLSLIASNHYAADSLTTRLTFNAIAGTVYSIAVDGFDAAEWTFRLNWLPRVQPAFTSIVRQGQNTQLTLTGGAGDRCDILSSSNLVNWTPLFSVTNSSGTIQFSDPASADLVRFYKALLQP